MWKIPLFDLNYDHREKDAVLEVLESRWLSAGARTEAFEACFSDYLGEGACCCAVSSGTAALHLALVAGDIGPGDEVILPGLTFVADLNVIMAVGAVPVPADSKSTGDWNISADDIAARITERTKALIVVHYAGQPCDMDPIAALCKERGILLIEDAAHAVGSTYRGRKCGILGEMACFSFFSNKNLSTGEGGMFVSRNEAYADRVRHLRSHGMTTMTIDRHRGRALSYDVVAPGFNYRIDEIRSALGIVQLEKLEEANARRRELSARYTEALSGLREIVIPFGKPEADKRSSCHIYPILVSNPEKRQDLMAFLKKRGIQSSIHYPGFSGFTFYKEMLANGLEIADRISGGVVTLPLFPSMTDAAVDLVTETITEFFRSGEDR